MSAHLDHTIHYVKDREETIEFYTNVLGFEHRGSLGRFEVIEVNEDFTIDLVARDDPELRHFAFAMDRHRFDEVFDRIRSGRHAYGDGPSSMDNMRGPGRSSGTHGTTYSVYFHDPSGHQLEIITYED
jgi:catechol 2,3-dioxygenase-like lactoylglutathione lyase family enzyme